MERDFMGLNFNNPLLKVKEEQEQLDESSQNSGFVAMSLSGGCNLGNNLQPTRNQTMQSSSIAHEDKMHPSAMYNPSIMKAHFSIQNPIIEAHFSKQNSHTATHLSKQNFASTIMNPPGFGRTPAMNSHLVIPSNAFVAGVTEPRPTSEPPGAPAELTIFYAGRVNVYNNISPEKAQTIMFMAANGCTTSDRPPSEVKVQASAPNYSARDDAFANKIIETSPNSTISSPMSTSSHPTSQTVGRHIRMEVPRAYKLTENPNSIISNVHSLKLETSRIPLTTSISPSAVPLPQARKASLARFLEKRKERIMSSSPYLLVNKSGEGTAESNAGSSATSGVDSSSMSMETDVNL